MKSASDVICCVLDTGGNYVALAQRLGKEYKHVYYTCPSWVDAYPRMNKPHVGYGLEGIEIIDSPWPVFSDIDLWVFPDCFYGPLQEFLISQGEIVWGSRNGEELELYRDALKDHMKELGLPVNDYKTITGFENLKNYLKKNEDVFVKINKWRGTVETFYSKNWVMIKPEIDEIEHHLEGLGDLIEFIAEQPIHDAVEIGYDGWTIDGQYPTSTLTGCEIKDKAYAGEFKPYSSQSPLVTDFNTKMADTFKKYGYRGFFSTEIRVLDKTPYMIDFTARVPCPPGEIYLELYKNLGEIMWAGANGILVDPVATGKFGVELLMESEWACHHFQPIYFPDKYASNVKLKKNMIMDGNHYCIPQPYESNDIGGIVGIGDTLEEAVNKVLEVADSIEGNGICIHQEALECAQEELDKFNSIGGNNDKATQ